MMLSAFFFCTMTVFVKLAGNEIGTMQIVLMRGIFTLIVTYFLIWKNNVHPFGNNKKILIFRGMVGTIALFLVFESIQRFSIPEATVIQYLYPIFTAILASFIISEYVGKVLYLSIIFGLFGVYIILDLPFQKEIPNVNFVDVAIAIDCLHEMEKKIIKKYMTMFEATSKLLYFKVFENSGLAYSFYENHSVHNKEDYSINEKWTEHLKKRCLYPSSFFELGYELNI